MSAGARPVTMTNTRDESVAVPSTIGADGMSFSIARTEASATPVVLSRTYSADAIGGSYVPPARSPYAAYGRHRRIRTYFQI